MGLPLSGAENHPLRRSLGAPLHLKRKWVQENLQLTGKFSKNGSGAGGAASAERGVPTGLGRRDRRSVLRKPA